MKTLLFILIFGCSFSAIAKEQIEFSGKYVFSGELRLKYALDRRGVYTYNEVGKSELAQLKEDGFVCVNQTSVFLICQKRYQNIEIPEDVKNKIRQKYEDHYVEFFESEQGPTLLTEGFDFLLWKIYQKVDLNGKLFSCFQFYENPTVSRLDIGEDNRKVALVQIDDYFLQEIRQPQGTMSYFVYLVVVAK